MFVLSKPQFKISKAQMIRGAACLLALVLFLLFLYWYNAQSTVSFGSSGVKYERAVILDVKSESLHKSDSGLLNGSQELRIRVLTGGHKKEIQTITNYLSDFYNVVGKKGGQIIVRVDTQNKDSYTISVFSHYRAPLVYVFVALFFGILWVVGGKKGLKSVLGLIFSFICILFLFLPLLYNGVQPIGASLLIVVGITLVTLLLLNGFTSKAYSAILGTILGVGIAAGAAVGAGLLLHVTGYSMPDAIALAEVTSSSKLKISGLLFGGLLISALGAVLDTAMSIASSVFEVHSTSPEIDGNRLFHAGMNVGRDMMGTMANTLILAFTGTSLMTLLLIYAYNVPYNQLINTDLVSTELIQALAGSIGVILTVPITAFISSRMIPKFKNTIRQTEVIPISKKKRAKEIKAEAR